MKGYNEVNVTIFEGRPLGYYKASEMAKLWNVKEVTIRTWVRRGKLESLKIGNDHWIPFDAQKPTRKNSRHKHVST